MVNYYDQLVANVEAVPGVEAVGLTDCLPLGWNRSWTIRAMDQPEDEEHEYGFFPRIVDFRYLRTTGIPLVAGALIGGLFGAILKTDERWDEVRLDGMRLAVTPRLGGGFAVGMMVAF